MGFTRAIPLLVAIVWSVSLTPTVGATANGVVAITGVVKTARGAPSGDSVVVLRDPASTYPLAVTRTAADGRYTVVLRGLRAGRYYVVAQDEESGQIGPVYVDVPNANDEATTIELTADINGILPPATPIPSLEPLRRDLGTNGPAEFGTPPSGEVPILFNDRHVYSKPDRLKANRVLAALVRGNTILIPLRSMFEQMGATVSYDPASKTVDVSKPGSNVKVTVGRPEVVINGESRPLDVPPEIYKGAVVVPVRVISEGMGAYVQWVPDRRIVVVRYVATVIPTPLPTPTPLAAPAKAYPQVVFFATDRSQLGASSFSADPTESMTYGKATLGVPFDIAPKPVNLVVAVTQVLILHVGPTTRISLEKPTLLAKDGFFSEIEGAVRNGVGADDEALVMIHGFNVPFEEALKTTALFAYLAEYRGPVISYDWPAASGGNVKANYQHDESVVAQKLTRDHLHAFLRTLARGSRVKRIAVVAHSMGVRLLLSTLRDMNADRRPSANGRFSRFATAAGDADQDDFLRTIDDVRFATVTNYSSSRDQALMASHQIPGHQPRIGEGGSLARTVPRGAAIDVSKSLVNWPQHGYLVEDKDVAIDVVRALHGEALPRKSVCSQRPPGIWLFELACS